MSVEYDDDVTFTAKRNEQCIAYFAGDGTCLYLNDSLSLPLTTSMAPIQRAILVARLRGFADLIEVAGVAS